MSAATKKTPSTRVTGEGKGGRASGSKALGGSKNRKSDGSNDFNLDWGTVNPKQAEFLASTTTYTAYGGARGGGKTHVLRIKAILGAQHYPGIRILIVRRTWRDLRNSLVTEMQKMIPPQWATYHNNHMEFNFANGSVIQFGHYQPHTGMQSYQGQEYDWIFIDEATQFTEDEFRILGASLRGANNIPKRFYLTCNPGGVGHMWLKRLFIDRKFFVDSAKPGLSENPDNYSFIPATVFDNEAVLKGSPEYVRMLATLPDKNLRKAWLDGDWDTLAGQYFGEFNEGLHVIEPMRKIPSDWVRYRTFDYGLDMLACLWIAVDFEGRHYVYRELNEPGLAASDAAKAIISNTPASERIDITFAPPDIWKKSQDTGKYIAESFQREGLGLVRADNNRVAGWNAVRELMLPLPQKYGDDGLPADDEAGLVFFDTCESLITNIQAIQRDDKNPNDAATKPHDITHNLDALRYYCQSRALPALRVEYAEDADDGFDRAEDYTHHMTGGEPTPSYLNY